jgi:hypothetical protein
LGPSGICEGGGSSWREQGDRKEGIYHDRKGKRGWALNQCDSGDGVEGTVEGDLGALLTRLGDS